MPLVAVAALVDGWLIAITMSRQHSRALGRFLGIKRQFVLAGQFYSFITHQHVDRFVGAYETQNPYRLGREPRLD